MKLLSFFLRYVLPFWAVALVAIMAGIQNHEPITLEIRPNTITAQERYESMVDVKDFPGCERNDASDKIPAQVVIVDSDTMKVSRVDFTNRFWNNRERNHHWIVLSC